VKKLRGVKDQRWKGLEVWENEGEKLRGEGRVKTAPLGVPRVLK